MSGFAQLGPVILPQADVRVDSRRAGRKDLAERGLLSSGAVRVDQVSNQAGDVTLSGRFRPPIPEDRVPMVAREFGELVSSDIGPLALFDQRGDTRAESGYYEIESGDVEPVHPSQPEIQAFSVSLKQVGGRGSHYRAVRTQQTTVSHPFGSGSGVSVFVPDAATKTRWYDRESETVQPATAAGTVASAQGTLQEFAAGGVAPNSSLLYDIPLSEDVTGSYVFSSPGLNAAKTNSNGVRQWPAVFDTSFTVTDPSVIVLSSQRLRLYLVSGDPSATTLSAAIAAQRWDAANSEWSNVGISSINNWAPIDVDLTEIGLHRLRAQVLFGDGSADPFAVDIALGFGQRSATVTAAPDESSAIPGGLQDKLGPVARTSEDVAQGVRTAVPKREVRR